jgi:hypothetical protein
VEGPGLKRAGFVLAATLIVYAIIELTIWVGLGLLGAIHGIRYEPLPLRALEPLQEYVLSLLIRDEHEYLSHDAELGWTVRPGGQSGLYRSNDRGLRATQQYAAWPPEGRVRVETFGDSFTHGDDVAEEHTWQARLTALDGRFELMNFGVPSYGPDQALLRYRREGRFLHPDWVVIGLLSENVHRVVNTFRPFYRPPTGVPLAKPRFELRSGALVLRGNPMPARADYQALLDDPEPVLRRLGEHDYYFQKMQRRLPFDGLPSVRLWTILETRFSTPSISRDGVYAGDSEAFQLTLAIVEAFRDEVVANGARPLVLLYPTSTDLRDDRAGRETRYGSLLVALRARGHRVVDVLGYFREHAPSRPVEELIRLHNTELGHALVAEAVLEPLRSPSE